MFFLCTWYFLDSFFIAALICSAWSYWLESKLDSAINNQKAIDFIVQKLNHSTISNNNNWAKEQLIEAGWLDNDNESDVF